MGPQNVASSIMVILVVAVFVTALALPWLPLPDQRNRTKSERLGAMIIVWAVSYTHLTLPTNREV